MKFFFFATTLIVFSCCVQAQKLSSFTSDSLKVGVNTQNNHDIIAKATTFKTNIYKASPLDSSLLLVQLRKMNKKQTLFTNTGEICAFNIGNNSRKWFFPVQYGSIYFQQFGNMLFQESAFISTRINILTGKPMWNSGVKFYYVNEKLGIGIGYKQTTQPKSNGKLQGISLNDGEKIWQRYVDHEYGWNGLISDNDTSVTIISSGLHSVSLSDGSGWDYGAVTGIDDYTSQVAAAATGIALGILTGVVVVPVGHDIITNIVSNVLQIDDYYYIATKDKIACINNINGTCKWINGFEKGFASNSEIFTHDSLLLMVNFGYGSLGNHNVNIGKPFIAAYSIETGNQLFMNVVSEKRKDGIQSYTIKDDEIWLAFTDRIAKYSLRTGELIYSNQTLLNNTSTNIFYFVDDGVYVDNDIYVLPIQDKFKEAKFVYISSDSIMVVNEHIMEQHIYSINEVYVKLLDNGDGISLLSRGDDWLLIDAANQKLARLDAGQKPFFSDYKLIYTKASSLFEIDLNPIIRE